MKLRDKQCEAELYVYMPESRLWFEYPVNNFLPGAYYREFTYRPDFMMQFVHSTKSHLFEKNKQMPEIYIYSACRLNFRRVAMLTDPRVNLAERDIWEWTYDWITQKPELTEEEIQQLPWNFEWVN